MSLQRAFSAFHSRWERILFDIVGISCLFFTFRFLLANQVPSASAAFAMGAFSFLYINISRFKKFKGLGFEAELWEEKQKEAEDLISRLRSVVAIYTREIITNAAMQGRWASGGRWIALWPLFDELVRQHEELGQRIDFSHLKQDLDGIFLFDLCAKPADIIRRNIDQARGAAQQKLQKKYGNVIQDVDGWNRDNRLLSQITWDIGNIFEKSRGGENVAAHILAVTKAACEQLDKYFSISCELNPDAMDRLRAIEKVSNTRPLLITPEILTWSEN